jgi:uncharacterized protein (TIGR03066 family)
MTTRLLVLAAALGGLLLLSACAGPEDAPKPEDKPNPTAKQPPAQKPWAELLIGTWKVIKVFNQPVTPDADVQETFSKEGTFSIRISSRKNGIEMKAGTYTLHGCVIRFTTPADAEVPEKSWEVTIEALSDKELATVSGPPDGLQRHVHRKVS